MKNLGLTRRSPWKRHGFVSPYQMRWNGNTREDVHQNTMGFTSHDYRFQRRNK